MAKIIFKNVSKSFGDDTVIKQLDFEIEEGSFTVLVGPSGCGKSTTLRMIAGLEKQTSGEIWIGDQCVNDIPPGKRDIAMVFQNFALYPTMTVKENIEFGLRNRKVPKKERNILIKDISEIVGLTKYLDRKPAQLSGGQRQRVALARAMVKKPKVFLMDEPLSNLDAKLRSQMRIELIELHKKLGTTFVYVTHDQVEAMSMGDQIVIMDKGNIQQADSPMEVYQNPQNTFVAKFIGTPSMNIIEVNHIIESQMKISNATTYIGFRPEKIKLDDREHEGLLLTGKVHTREILGSETIYQTISNAGTFMVKSFGLPVEVGTQLEMKISYSDLYYFNQAGDRIQEVENKKFEGLVVGGNI
jgi:sn-glycerol 3-phosphate transport system ATP-binding protein